MYVKLWFAIISKKSHQQNIPFSKSRAERFYFQPSIITWSVHFWIYWNVKWYFCLTSCSTTNSLEKKPSWEANFYSADEEFPHLLWKSDSKTSYIYPAVFGEFGCFAVQCLFNSFTGVEIVFCCCSSTRCLVLAYFPLVCMYLLY